MEGASTDRSGSSGRSGGASGGDGGGGGGGGDNGACAGGGGGGGAEATPTGGRGKTETTAAAAAAAAASATAAANGEVSPPGNPAAGGEAGGCGGGGGGDEQRRRRRRWHRRGQQLRGRVHHPTGPWRLVVARVAAAREATVASATGTADGREDGGWRQGRRWRRRVGDIQNTFSSADCWGYSRTPSHGLGRPAHAAADQVLINIDRCMMINSVMLAGAKGGKVERRPTFGSVHNRVGRAGAVPLAT